MGRKMIARAFLLSVLFLACAGPARYFPPEDVVPGTHNVTVERSFDETWRILIGHLAHTTHSFGHVEKESGLITLDFDAQRPELYVECGLVEKEVFEGPTRAQESVITPVSAARDLNWGLEGWANIVVQPVKRSTKTRRRLMCMRDTALATTYSTPASQLRSAWSKITNTLNGNAAPVMSLNAPSSNRSCPSRMTGSPNMSTTAPVDIGFV